jgi:hypothetical protein
VLPRARHAAIAGVDATVNDPNAKRALHARTRALGVDMESHVAARIAHDHGLPFVACRVILDPAHRTLPPAARVSLRVQAVRDPRAVLRSVTAEPSQLPGLIRLALDASIAKMALRCGRALLGPSFAFPDFYQSKLLKGRIISIWRPIYHRNRVPCPPRGDELIVVEVEVEDGCRVKCEQMTEEEPNPKWAVDLGAVAEASASGTAPTIEFGLDHSSRPAAKLGFQRQSRSGAYRRQAVGQHQSPWLPRRTAEVMTRVSRALGTKTAAGGPVQRVIN